jgi:hypothetical protein
MRRRVTDGNWGEYMHISYVLSKKKDSVAFSPQANYTNWATATCRRNLVPSFADRGVLRSQRGGSPHGR